MRTALQQNYNLSVSGGSDKTTYMVSLAYYDQESNYVGNSDFGVQRYNFRTNITTEVGRLKLNAILAYTRNNSVSTPVEAWRWMLPVYQPTITTK